MGRKATQKRGKGAKLTDVVPNPSSHVEISKASFMKYVEEELKPQAEIAVASKEVLYTAIVKALPNPALNHTLESHRIRIERINRLFNAIVREHGLIFGSDAELQLAFLKHMEIMNGLIFEEMSKNDLSEDAIWARIHPEEKIRTSSLTDTVKAQEKTHGQDRREKRWKLEFDRGIEQFTRDTNVPCDCAALESLGPFYVQQLGDNMKAKATRLGVSEEILSTLEETVGPNPTLDPTPEAREHRRLRYASSFKKQFEKDGIVINYPIQQFLGKGWLAFAELSDKVLLEKMISRNQSEAGVLLRDYPTPEEQKALTRLKAALAKEKTKARKRAASN